MTPQEREYQRTYARSAKRKASRRLYNQSAHGRAKNNAQCLRWRRDNPEKYAASLRKHDLKRHYGLTPEKWDEIFTAQGSKCAGCGSTHPRVKTRKWSTDHCHTTGRVRGILCRGCNSALGHALDSPAALRALADYLERGQL